MNLFGLLPLIESLDAYKHLTASLQSQDAVVADVIESARAAMLVALSRTLDVSLVVLTPRAPIRSHRQRRRPGIAMMR